MKSAWLGLFNWAFWFHELVAVCGKRFLGWTHAILFSEKYWLTTGSSCPNELLNEIGCQNDWLV